MFYLEGSRALGEKENMKTKRVKYTPVERMRVRICDEEMERQRKLTE